MLFRKTNAASQVLQGAEDLQNMSMFTSLPTDPRVFEKCEPSNYNLVDLVKQCADFKSKIWSGNELPFPPNRPLPYPIQAQAPSVMVLM